MLAKLGKKTGIHNKVQESSAALNLLAIYAGDFLLSVTLIFRAKPSFVGSGAGSFIFSSNSFERNFCKSVLLTLRIKTLVPSAIFSISKAGSLERSVVSSSVFFTAFLYCGINVSAY